MNSSRLVIPDGTVESIKWLALVLMTGDHINKYLLNGTNDFLFAGGRVAMPLFVFVLAYNLARPSALERGVYIRTMKRLALFGLATTPAFICLGGLDSGWWPLNIMFTLLAATVTLYLIELGEKQHLAAAASVFLVAGSFIEFWWPALTLCLAIWWYFKLPNWKPLALGFAALGSLWFVNSNLWALAATPIFFAAPLLNLRVPRLRWFFYAYYPLHLIGLWLIRIPMSKAGYLFF